jgi:5'-methylthioadenosine phosphorylase
MMKLGVIGGSGFYDIDSFDFVESLSVDTPVGCPSDKYFHYKSGVNDVYFLPRHGAKHSILPHKINYRANLYGFAQLGVKKVLSISAVGGLTVETGEYILPDNGIDLTSGRDFSFIDTGVPKIPIHVDFTYPFCNDARRELIDAAGKAKIVLKDGGVYICTNGPRLETAAEIKAFALWGGDIVGMTLFPECVLARELSISYANISVVTNKAAGMAKMKLTVEEVKSVMSSAAGDIKRLIKELIRSIGD